MTVLNNRIDFMFVISVEGANPNGDPTASNTPREDSNGYGEISDVCLKHKIRNYLHETGEEILVLPTEITGESLMSTLKKSGLNKLLNKSGMDQEKFKKEACEKWFDVRTFGQVFGLKQTDTSSSVSTSVRGPMSIRAAYSIEPIITREINITNVLNLEKQDKRDHNTWGSRYVVEYGAYVSYGSIFPNLAEKTGFSEEDAEKIKQAILNLFLYDATSSRPSGSMTLSELHWWTHDCASGRHSPAKVFHSYSFKASEKFPFYEIKQEYTLDRVKEEIYHYYD